MREAPSVYDVGVHDLRADFRSIVQGLSVQVVGFAFEDAVRRIELRGLGFGYGEAEHGKIQAWIRLADGSVRVEDITESGELTFCRDQPDEDVAEVQLVYSNGLADKSGANLINFPREGAEMVNRTSCGGFSGTLTVTETIAIGHGDGVDTFSGTREVETTVALQLVEDPESPGSFVAGPGSTHTTMSSQDSTYVRGDQCTGTTHSTGAGSGPLAADAAALIPLEESGTERPVLLLLHTDFDQDTVIASDDDACGNQSYSDHLDFLPACPSANGWGLTGTLSADSSTVTFDCTDTQPGPFEGDTTTTRVTGTLTA